MIENHSILFSRFYMGGFRDQTWRLSFVYGPPLVRVILQGILKETGLFFVFFFYYLKNPWNVLEELNRD